MAIKIPDDHSLPPYPQAVQDIVDEIKRMLNKHGRGVEKAIEKARQSGFPNIIADIGIFFASPYFDPTILERKERNPSTGEKLFFCISAEDGRFLNKIGIKPD